MFLIQCVRKVAVNHKRYWKWRPRASIKAWAHLILFANTFCRSACEIFLMYAVIAGFNSLSVRGWSRYTAAQVHSDFPNALYNDASLNCCCVSVATQIVLCCLRKWRFSFFSWSYLSSPSRTPNLCLCKVSYCRSQWPRDLRLRPSVARLVRLWVRIPSGAWMSVCCECCQVEVSATGWSLVQRSPSDCGASCCVI